MTNPLPRCRTRLAKTPLWPGRGVLNMTRYYWFRQRALEQLTDYFGSSVATMQMTLKQQISRTTLDPIGPQQEAR